MGESAYLRARDYRTMFRLIGECRDLGADPVVWRRHLLTELCGQLGARVGAGGEATGLARQQFIPLTTVDVGWENDSQRQAMIDWMQRQAETHRPTALLPLRKPVDGSVIMSRDDAYTDDEWYNSVQFCDYVRRAELDHLVISLRRVNFDTDRYCGLMLMRPHGESKFTAREKSVLATLHQHLAPLVGRQLAAAHEPSATQLAPRLRQVLECLLEGDSEKQVAGRLGLKPQTVNQYVKAVYRHFRVNSRAELMARWIRFSQGLPAQRNDNPGISSCNGKDRGRRDSIGPAIAAVQP